VAFPLVVVPSKLPAKVLSKRDSAAAACVGHVKEDNAFSIYDVMPNQDCGMNSGMPTYPLQGLLNMKELRKIESAPKNTFSGPKNFTPMKPRRAFGFLVLRFVLQLDTNVSRRPGFTVLFRSCEFTVDSLIESACHKQTALSCSHPSGSGPRSLLSVTEAPGPIPTPSGPEQRQYRTLFNRLSIQRDGRNRPCDLPRRTRHSNLADSWRGRKRFQRT